MVFEKEGNLKANENVSSVTGVAGDNQYNDVSAQESSTSDHLRLLNSIARDIVSSLTIEDIVMRVHENLCCLMDGVMIALGVYNSTQYTLDFYGVGGCKETLGYGKVSLAEGDVWTVRSFNEGKEFIFNSPPKDSGYRFSNILFNSEQPRNSFVYIPLIFKRQPLGVLTVQSHRENAFSQQDQEILRSMGYYLAIALENANNYQKVQRQKEEILRQNKSLMEHRNHLEELVNERTQEINRQKEALVVQSKKLELLSIVAEKTENAIMIMDAVGNIIWINDFFTRIYGYNYQEFIRARGSNIKQTSFNPQINEKLNTCICKRIPVYYEAPNIAKDKRTKWTHTTLTPILDSKGQITHLVAIDSDITDRKEKEQKIVKYSHEITESIQYAWKIQRAMLPPPEYLGELLPHHFVLFKPKGIVSGDFYWAARLGERIIIAAADCTGHGVPGGFMSVMGISLLNEIVREFELKSAAEVLNILRKQIKQTLHQDQGKGETRDGMDISLCIIDPVKLQIQYAGAYQPVIIANDEGVQVIRGDRMPIGVYPKEREEFTNHVVNCKPGDTYYILSDGFTSMFGGPNMKKYRMNQLLELIGGVHSFPMNQQRERFDREMQEWLGADEHVDDTLLIGFRVLP